MQINLKAVLSNEANIEDQSTLFLRNYEVDAIGAQKYKLLSQTTIKNVRSHN